MQRCLVFISRCGAALMQRRGAIKAALGTFPLILLLSCSAAPSGEQVAFSLGWLPQGSVIGVIVAKERGFYKQAGLEVTLTRGFGGIRTANEVDQGLFQFGYADPVAVVLNRARGGHVRMIGAINDRWPGGLCFVDGRTRLATPADLAGKTIGGANGSPMQVLLPILLARKAVDAKRVRLLQMDPSVIDASLIEGVIDAAECWLGSNKALLQQRAAQAGKRIGWLAYATFGLDMYGSGIVASDDYLAAHPETARKLLAATYHGYQWAGEHRQEAADLLAKRFPPADRAVARQQIGEIAALIKGPGPIGQMRGARMKKTLDLLARAYHVERHVAVQDIYTNRFLQNNPPKKGQQNGQASPRRDGRQGSRTKRHLL